MPYSTRPRELPFIPLESEIDAFIAGSSKKGACFLQLLKETWARAGEAWELEWTDIDSECNIITINNPEKQGMPRQIKVSSKLISMLNKMPKKFAESLWRRDAQAFQKSFILQRKRVASKLNNLRINKTTFHML